MSFEKINEIEQEIDATKQILCENIDQLTDRGESLHLLVDKSDQLSNTVNLKFCFNENHLCSQIYTFFFKLQSVSFKVTSTNLARSYYWKHIRLIAGFFLLSLVIIIFNKFFVHISRNIFLKKKYKLIFI